MYRAFNLIIDSPIHMPEAMPLEGEHTADVTVSFSPVDLSTFEAQGIAVERGKGWQIIPSDKHLLFGSEVGIYEIRDGAQITVEVMPGAPEEKVRIFLLGSAMGAVQVQRGRIPVHGGAVVSDGRAIIITGQQGAGKSTMTSAFVHNGFKYLTDDVASVELGETGNLVLPAYPQRKLVRDACAPLGYAAENLVMVDSARDKFAVRDRENWYSTPVPLGMLVELFPAEDGEPLQVEPVNGHARLEMILRSLYRVRMHFEGDNIPPAVFKKMLTIAAGTEMYYAYIPRGIENITKYAEELAQALGITP